MLLIMENTFFFILQVWDTGGEELNKAGQSGLQHITSIHESSSRQHVNENDFICKHQIFKMVKFTLKYVV